MIQLDSENTRIKVGIINCLHEQKDSHKKNRAINAQLDRNELRAKLQLNIEEGKLHQPINDLVKQKFITQVGNPPYSHAVTDKGEAVWEFFNP